MHDTRLNWLRLGAGFLAVSFIATFMQTSGNGVGGRTNALILEGWLERASFWLGLVFIAGYILDTVYGARRGR